MRNARILIIDDEPDICALLAESLASPRWQVDWITRPLEALQKVKSEKYDLILLDIKMPEISGLELLPGLKKATPDTAILVMSAFGNISIAVEAMKRGAEDYLEKPFRSFEEVRLAAKRLIETVQVHSENRHLHRQLEEEYQLASFTSASPRMQAVYDLIKKVAPLATTILITGESGTGKELIARSLHYQSQRSQAPFISVNCSGLPEGLLESLLFGHERGAFTGAVRRTRGYFEEAEGGSLFLDEIGEMPASLQVKFLRVLQERSFQRVGDSRELSVDVRLIAATNKNLEAEVRSGHFRQDLYYRLNVITIALPALRERREDIPLLTRHFLERFSAAFHLPAKGLSREAMDYLCTRDWPGNIRQLEHTLERAVALTPGALIDRAAFAPGIPSPGEELLTKISQLSLREARLLFEKRYLLDTLRRYHGNVTLAARAAGLPRQNLHRKMKSLGIVSERKLQKHRRIAELEPA